MHRLLNSVEKESKVLPQLAEKQGKISELKSSLNAVSKSAERGTVPSSARKLVRDLMELIHDIVLDMVRQQVAYRLGGPKAALAAELLGLPARQATGDIAKRVNPAAIQMLGM